MHVVKWGFPASKDKGSIQMLKLLLDPQQELPPYVSRTKLEAQLKQIGRGAVEATADFLDKLKIQALEALDKRYGKAFMATTKIDYILTVPAVWSDAAKDATLRAAEMAGLHKSRNLQMITEPEAAALYALKQMEGVTLTVGDTYIIADCGGGTVDQISYLPRPSPYQRMCCRYWRYLWQWYAEHALRRARQGPYGSDQL